MFVIATIAVSLGLAAQARGQATSRAEESPRERFERKGGKSVQVRITATKGGELTGPTVTDERDLRLYDQGGHFACRSHIPGTEKNYKENQKQIEKTVEVARVFIWQHWQDKKRGYIRLTFDSVDALSTAHIFVEPDAAGKWQIVWKWARDSGSVDTLPLIRALEQTPGERGRRILLFEDADGEEWQRL
jgi:hypothetical protein